MIKILIAQEIQKMLQQRPSFLDRTEVKVFTAASSEEALKIHRAERVNLIISQFDMPGMSCERFCSLVRDDPGLKWVSMIMVCANNSIAIEAASRCNANAVMLRPINPSLLLAKAKQLLDISSRETRRVLVHIGVDGNSNKAAGGFLRDEAFFCHSQNICASGMLIETKMTLAPGDRVVCSLSLYDTLRLRMTGEIVRGFPHREGLDTRQYGVRFLNLSTEDKKALDTFVNTQVRQASSDAA